MKKFIAILGIGIILTGSVFALESENKLNLPIYQYKLKEGKGKTLVETYCQMCHSVGYILNNAGVSKKTWEHIVHHMINDFKAPIDEKVAKQIIDYLVKNYGKVDNEH